MTSSPEELLRHAPLVRKIAWRITVSGWTVEDREQEAWLRIFQQRRAYDPARLQLGTWVGWKATRALQDARRSVESPYARARRRRPPSWHGNLADVSQFVGQSCRARRDAEARHDIEVVLSALPPRWRLSLEGSVRGVSVRARMQQLRVSDTRVSQLVSQGRRRCRELFPELAS